MLTGERSEGRQAEQATGLHIRELLVRPGGYRDRWELEGGVEGGTAPAEVSQAAVSRVLARHLRETGEELEFDLDLPRLEDRVGRALRGVGLSPWLLNTFTAAFRFSEDDREHLATLYRAPRRRTGVVGDLPPPDQVPGYRAPAFDTLELRERHWLGADGLPVRHRTRISIRSRVDGLDRYQYRMDTPHAKINTILGGRKTELYAAGGGIWATDLVFPRPLLRGEAHNIEFWALLRYYRPPPREMRRGTHERIEDLDIRVCFHRDKRPSTVWWAEWAHYTGPDNKVIYREPYELDGDLTVHRHVGEVERAVVGFGWNWADSTK